MELWAFIKQHHLRSAQRGFSILPSPFSSVLQR